MERRKENNDKGGCQEAKGWVILTCCSARACRRSSSCFAAAAASSCLRSASSRSASALAASCLASSSASWAACPTWMCSPTEVINEHWCAYSPCILADVSTMQRGQQQSLSGCALALRPRLNEQSRQGTRLMMCQSFNPACSKLWKQAALDWQCLHPSPERGIGPL